MGQSLPTLSNMIGDSILVEETRCGPFELKVTTGSSTFIVDEPIGEGLGAGPDPFALLSAAIGSCALMTMRLYARNRKWPLEDARMKVTHLRPTLTERDVFVNEVELTGPLTLDQKTALIEIAGRSPVHLTLTRCSVVRTLLVADKGIDAKATSRSTHARQMKEACTV